MKRNICVTVFMCLVMGCAVENRSTNDRAGADQTEQVSTTTASLTGLDLELCLEGCMQDCGECPGGSTKADCVRECRAENLECQTFCRNQ